MPLWFKTETRRPSTSLESQERKVSLALSLLVAALMLGGLGGVLAGGAFWRVPGRPAPPLPVLLSQTPLGLAAMSLGILLLGVLPLLRVALAAKAYAHAKVWGDFLVALTVLAELLLSLLWSG
jgi:hypothetical protein